MGTRLQWYVFCGVDGGGHAWWERSQGHGNLVGSPCHLCLVLFGAAVE